MPNFDSVVEECQPPTSMPTICTFRSKLCRQTRQSHLYPRYQHIFMLRSSLYPCIMFAFFFSLLLAQQRTGANAFLLAHRKMFVPFASSRLGSSNNGANTDAEVPAHLVGFLMMPKRHATTPLIAAVGEQKLLDDDDELGQLNDCDDDDGQPSVRDEETESQTLENLFGTMGQRQNQYDGDAATDDDQLHMDKRMHHLSILRKIGAPSASGPASRLFGPFRQRELKRRSWMIQY